jgi:ornithine decarboxylase
MGLSKTIWTNPSEFLRIERPVDPVMFFAPAVLQDTARRFLDGFPGLVTYAVKSNPDEMVIQNLVAAGIEGFDVASPAEIEMIARLAPTAAMHYNNPVRARHEIAFAVDMGVKSYSVDSRSELAKLVDLVPAEGTEISVRFKLPVAGAAYNFGAKFGATVDLAAELLREVADHGFTPSLTFHPGTQCTDPMAWDAYIRAAAEICRLAGVRARRLNTGGGFPSHRVNGEMPQLEAIFALIGRVAEEAFAGNPPALVCEPGRGLVAEAFTLAAQVKAVRDGAHVFLNDGTYGALDELPITGMIDRIAVLAPEGGRRRGEAMPRVVFGPTCDSVDRLPGEVMLPADIAEGDYVVLSGMGAYSTATNTRFNGFGALTIATVMRLDA